MPAPCQAENPPSPPRRYCHLTENPFASSRFRRAFGQGRCPRTRLRRRCLGALSRTSRLPPRYLATSEKGPGAEVRWPTREGLISAPSRPVLAGAPVLESRRSPCCFTGRFAPIVAV